MALFHPLALFKQGRFADAVANLKEWVQQADAALAYAFLAASYGHLGQLEAAKAALARYRELSPAMLEERARVGFSSLYDQSFRDGIALAEAKSR